MKQPAITTGSGRSRGLLAVFGGLILLLGIGCSGDSPSPTAPAGSDLFMTSANIVVHGQSVGGQTLSKGRGAGDSTRFEAQLLAHSGTNPTSSLMIWVEFDRPQGMGMGRHTGRLSLYDDGTHGDHVASDGLYSFEDSVGDYGMHSMNSPTGEYHYEFYGAHEDHDTNRIRMTVTVVDA